MQIYLIKGNGSFTDNEGKLVKYPITKLCIQAENGDTVSTKLDKEFKLLLPYIFELKNSGQMIEDEQGNEVEIVYISEKGIAKNKIVVE